MTAHMRCSDERALKEVYDKNQENGFYFPDICSPRVVCGRVAYNEGLIVGGLVVRDICEGILLIDRSLPLTLKTRIVNRLIDESKRCLKHKSIHECHVFIKDPKFSNYLMEHHQFRPTESGECLVWTE